MILADKITKERKKNGWSQEELANQLGVSRQAVSKWESAGAVPDLQRILQMSELFGIYGLSYCAVVVFKFTAVQTLSCLCVLK